MNHEIGVLVVLFVVFVAAQIGAEIAQRLKMPGVVGEIAAGCIIGPSVLGWVEITARLEVIAEIGAIILLFAVGLETRLDDLKKVGRSATAVGVLGVLLPFVLGGLWGHYSGFATPKAMFVATAFVATSAGITARVLQEIGVLDRIESRVIMGAAVIDDILAMLLLGVVTAVQGGGEINVPHLLFVLFQAVGFVVLIAVAGGKIMRRSSNLLEAPINPRSPLTLSLALCLGLAAAAAYIGLAAIIGAFLAGMVLAETRQREVLEQQLKPIEALMVPFFFVVTGANIKLTELANVEALTTLAVITLLAIVSKLVGCGLGAWSMGARSALIVGVGMVPRGEVGIIIASLGRQAEVISDSLFAIIIAMSLLTSVVAPPALTALFTRAPKAVPAADPSVPN